MLAGELVGTMDVAIAVIAEGGLVSAAEDGGLIPAAKITLYLHLKNKRLARREGERSGFEGQYVEEITGYGKES